MKEHTLYMRKWRKEHPENANYHKLYMRQWRKKNPEKCQEYSKTEYRKNYRKEALRKKKYLQTEKGKQAHRKNQRIQGAKRKRNLGWILMFDNPFDESEQVDYHHITNAYVVAIPKDLHQLYCGKYHREKVMEIAKQIYLGE